LMSVINFTYLRPGSRSQYSSIEFILLLQS
jgi:hypothetical protein